VLLLPCTISFQGRNAQPPLGFQCEIGLFGLDSQVRPKLQQEAIGSISVAAPRPRLTMRGAWCPLSVHQADAGHFGKPVKQWAVGIGDRNTQVHGPGRAADKHDAALAVDDTGEVCGLNRFQIGGQLPPATASPSLACHRTHVLSDGGPVSAATEEYLTADNACLFKRLTSRHWHTEIVSSYVD
jgi:hypothetical protein